MKKKTKVMIYLLAFLIAFITSAILRIVLLGSAPERMIKVEWNDSTGKIYTDLDYENSNGNQYDLYIPTNLNKNDKQNLMLFIHGGSFNSGSKKDGEAWCKYFAKKGYICASVDYSLQNHGKDASIYRMDSEILAAVDAIKNKSEDLGCQISGMAPFGVSAGGTLAMNLAYGGKSPIPVRFVFQLSAPTYFDASEWSLLKRVDGLKTDAEFYEMMTGMKQDHYDEQIRQISPASLVTEDSPPSLIGYGLKDHCVPLTQKYYLIDSYKEHHVKYDYVEFPHSNHGMYNDPERLKEFLEKAEEYARTYFVSE